MISLLEMERGLGAPLVDSGPGPVLVQNNVVVEVTGVVETSPSVVDTSTEFDAPNNIIVPTHQLHTLMESAPVEEKKIKSLDKSLDKSGRTGSKSTKKTSSEFKPISETI